MDHICALALLHSTVFELGALADVTARTSGSGGG